MLRAIVLVLCLASAGVIAAYSYYSRGESGEPVYTVPSPAPVPPVPKPASPRQIAPDDQVALARELQRELKRVGCYMGEVSGVWTPGSRLAMKAFVEHVNAALPVDKPDPVLLSLVQGYRERACGVPGVAAATGKEPPSDAKADSKTGAAAGAAAAGAAAGMALVAPGSAAKKDAKVSAAEAGPDVSVPPDAKPAKRPRRTTKRPPKIVSDFMKLFGK
jgi:hypothetical protein